MPLCRFLCSNDIKAGQICRLLSAQRSKAHLRTFPATFGSLRKVVGNFQKSLGRFRKFRS